jgi:hypothetical protein
MEKNWTEESVGWIAFAFSSYFLLYPAIPFYNVLKGKLNYEDSPGAYATVNYLNCFCWFLYSEMLISDQIKIISGIGTVASGLFVLVYLYYEIRKYIVDAVLNALILCSGSYMIYLTLTVMIEDDAIIGKICSGTHCLVFYFPIRLIYKVLKEKNFMLIPFCQAWGSLFMSISWVVYGILITEIYVVFPHCINIILATVQIMLFLNYRRKYPIINGKDYSSSIGIENEELKKEESKVKEEINEDNDTNLKERPVKIVEKENN